MSTNCVLRFRYIRQIAGGAGQCSGERILGRAGGSGWETAGGKCNPAWDDALHTPSTARDKIYRPGTNVRIRHMNPETDIYSILIRKRQEILSLAQRRGAKNIRVFGSVVRNEARADSDIDLLIDLDPDRSLLDVGGLAMDLTLLLDRPVDVVTEAGLRDRIRSRVLSEARAL